MDVSTLRSVSSLQRALEARLFDQSGADKNDGTDLFDRFVAKLLVQNQLEVSNNNNNQ